MINKLMQRAIPLIGAGALMLHIAQAAVPQRAVFRMIRQQPQGFENMSQVPSKYTSAQRAAADVARRWIDLTDRKDLAGEMAMVDNEIVYRADPAMNLGHGARGFCSAYNFAWDISWVRLDELYVLAGRSQALVLMKRSDMDMPAGSGGPYEGDFVPVAMFARVADGKIAEWLDAPVTPVGPLTNSSGANTRPVPLGVRPACAKYATSALQPAGGPPGGVLNLPGPTPRPVEPTLGGGMLTYGTIKVESQMDADEVSALQTIRAWFAARKANDPLLLAAFTDKNVVFRATPEAHSITDGRDALLRAVCATMSGSLDVTDIFVVGGSYDSSAIVGWSKTDASGKRVSMGSFLRVQKDLVTEWMDAPLDGTPVAADPDSAACQKVNTTLAAFPSPPVNGIPAGRPPGGPPAGSAPRP